MVTQAIRRACVRDGDCETLESGLVAVVAQGGARLMQHNYLRQCPGHSLHSTLDNICTWYSKGDHEYRQNLQEKIKKIHALGLG